MKTILVPTDFSRLAKVAVSYAIGLAKEIDANIIVLSVLNSEASSESMKNWKKFEADMIKTAQQDADKLMGELKQEKGKVEIWYRSVLGFPIYNKIEEFAVKKKVDVIVMGSKGATGLKGILMGSNAAAVVDNSSVPVIVIPGSAKFKPIKKLVYATDAQNFLKEAKVVSAVAEQVGASMEVLHVIPNKPPNEKKQKDELKISRDKLVEMTRYPKIHLHVVHNNDVVDGIDKFVKGEKADLLAVFTHRLDFKEKLFGKGITRKLAFHNQVPLLTFNKTNRKQTPAKVQPLMTAQGPLYV